MPENADAASGPVARLVALWHTSLRARLALTYAATIALALLLFAAATSVYLTRSGLARVDASLAETLQLVRQALADEATERATLAVAAADAVRDVRFSDRRVLMYDATGQLIAVSDSTALSDAVVLATLRDLHAPTLAALVTDQLNAASRHPATIGTDDASVRGLAQSETYRGTPLTVVVLRGLATEEEASETFIGWLLATIPVALLFAGFGGYLLARASLAPALALAEQAERIGATSLDARLSVCNPHDELGRLAGVLNDLLSRLEHSFIRQRTFMSDASHELRTPIAVVRSAADVALATPGATVDSLQEALRIVHVEGVRMSRIVNDLFLLARADSVAHPIQRQHLFLEEIVIEAARAARTLGRESGIAVTVAADIEAPFVGDGNLLGRLLLNLMDNAVQFSPAGAEVRVALDVCAKPQRQDGVQLQGAWYRITVDDDGPGVDPAVRDTLFERFVRADRPPTAHAQRAASGAGLGLAIALWVTDVHGGHVWHDASRIPGSRFMVLLRKPDIAADLSASGHAQTASPETAERPKAFQNA
jgi:two-component system, OmpR family, sensor kinase